MEKEPVKKVLEKIDQVDKKIEANIKALGWHIEEERAIHKRAALLEDRFNKHIEIYAANGREMKQMWQTMESYRNDMLKQWGEGKREAIEQRQILLDQIREMREENKPVLEAFTGLTWSKKALIWVLGLIGSVIGIVIAVRSFYKN